MILALGTPRTANLGIEGTLCGIVFERRIQRNKKNVTADSRYEKDHSEQVAARSEEDKRTMIYSKRSGIQET